MMIKVWFTYHAIVKSQYCSLTKTGEGKGLIVSAVPLKPTHPYPEGSAGVKMDKKGCKSDQSPAKAV